VVTFDDEYEEDFWCSVYLHSLSSDDHVGATATADKAIEALRERATKLDDVARIGGESRHGPS
jgi:hypothetical protein